MTSISSPPLPRLPVSDVLCALSDALASHRRAVLVAPPGAGKTTLVPLHLLLQMPESAGKIILVEPRRLAARAAARRMADLVGGQVGETVGWRMRLDTKVSGRTRIEVVTEGVLTRMILADPELSDIGTILFDEFHERSLDGDFGLALALDVASALREDLTLLVMSATLDGARVARLLGGAPVIESRGRAYPVTIRHHDRSATERIEDSVASAVLDTLKTEAGSLLVFLPGQREIERVAERLAGKVGADVHLAPLYGALDAAAQDRAIRPAPEGTRKVVLATSIAETSLTIDGVTVVVDSGLRRLPVFEPATGLSRLETVRVSKAAADQRAGRAGRTAPGVAIRLWRAEQTGALDAFDRPEILATDLSGLVLDCAAWGVAEPSDLAFLDPPPAPAIAEARSLLTDLGALDAAQRLTPTGDAMRQLPLPPRLARMVVDAPKAAGAGTADAAFQARRTAARIAVLLTERGLGGTAVDLAERLRGWLADRGPRARDAETLARRIAANAGSMDVAVQGVPATAIETGALLALAYPDRIAVQRGAAGHFVLSNGRGGMVDAASPLSRESFLVVADLQGQARDGRIFAAARLGQADVDAIFAARGTTEDIVEFDRAARAVRARRVRRIGRAVLTQAPIPAPAGPQTSAALVNGIRQLGLSSLPFGKEGERLLARMRFLANAMDGPQGAGGEAGSDGRSGRGSHGSGHDIAVWPDLTDANLLAILDGWLTPYLPGISALSDIAPGALCDALRGLIPPAHAGRLDELAPSHFTAPTGSHVPIRYEEEQPVLAIRVQELFGLRVHPSIADGRLPLTVELLSPAHRPIQVTRDLPGFWAGSWADVRADLRGRYPRHEWPEDPANAAPTARAKPRA